MIGQGRLIRHLEYMIDRRRFKNFTMLVGPKGSGKRTLAHHIANDLMGVDLHVIPELKVDAVRNILEDALTLRQRKVYLIPDADDMTPQAQNALLKFLEEPPSNAYIIMTVQDFDRILSTIRSRADVQLMMQYTKEELSMFTPDKVLIEACQNPGQIIRAVEAGYQPIYELAVKVIENIGNANAANVFKIATSFKIEDADLFFNFLDYHLNRKLMKAFVSDSKRLFAMSAVIVKHRDLMRNKSVNKLNLLEMFLIQLREVAM